jgi:hypothetical protein
MEWHPTAKPKKISGKPFSQPVRSWPLSVGMLKDACWSKFCHMAKSSMLHITFICSKSFNMHCVRNVQRRKISPLQQDTAGSQTADVYMNIIKNGWELFPTSSYSPDLAPLDYC